MQFGALVDIPVVGVVEDLWDRTPSRPARQDWLLVDVGPPAALVAATVQNGERVEVRSQLGGGARRGEGLLAGGSKGRGPRQYLRFVYSGVLMAWLISARAW